MNHTNPKDRIMPVVRDRTGTRTWVMVITSSVPRARTNSGSEWTRAFFPVYPEPRVGSCLLISWFLGTRVSSRRKAR
jgi:hypothetical protein